MHRRGHYKAYSQASLNIAVERMQKGEISAHEASRTYAIPKTTLLDKVHGRRPLVARQGPNPILSDREESDLVAWAIQMSKIGYGRTKQELVLSVKKVLDEDGRPNPFKNNTPGRDWMKGFMKRHPELSIRVPEGLGRERASVTVDKIMTWFDDLEAYFQEGEVEDGLAVFADPSRIFNADETGFPLAGGKMEKVLAPRGARDVYLQSSSDKTQITVLACASAAGVFLPPMLIFQGVRFHYNPTEGGPEGAVFGRSANGWIDSEVFYEWIANHFLTFLRKHSIKLPVVLFVDGHSTHINLETATFCRKNKIVLYCLPPHTTHVLQPLDVACFRSLKKRWGTDVRHYQIMNPGAQVTKKTFAPVFRLSWEAAATPLNAVNGFRKCGLYPLDRHAIDKNKLAPAQVYAPQVEVQGGEQGHQQQQLPAVIPEEQRMPNRHQQPQAAHLQALLALESCIGPDKKKLFETRKQEGYDLKDDDLYNTWATMKEKASKPQPTADTANTPGPSGAANTSGLSGAGNTPGPSGAANTSGPLGAANTPGPSGAANTPGPSGAANIPGPSGQAPKKGGKSNPTPASSSSSVFANHLRYPVAIRSPKTKVTRQNEKLPKAVSGDRFVAYLREKDRKKKEEDERREKKKQERERKKVEGQRGREGGRKQKKAGSKQGSMPKRSTITEDSDSDESDVDMINEDICSACREPYDNKPENWMGCEECRRWFHSTQRCTGIDGIEVMSEKEIAELDWWCDFCV